MPHGAADCKPSGETILVSGAEESGAKRGVEQNQPPGRRKFNFSPILPKPNLSPFLGPSRPNSYELPIREPFCSAKRWPRTTENEQ